MSTALPVEIVEQVVLALLPASVPVAYRSDDPITKTLLSLLVTCKATTQIATRLLYNHCLYIDSPRKLELLLRALESPNCRNALSSPIHSHTGLYLSPFPNRSIDDPMIVSQIDELFYHLSSSLERLVIDIHLRFTDFEDETFLLRPALREAFTRLRALTEFTSVRDELYLSTRDGRSEAEVWASWTKLQRLALYNVDVAHPSFISALHCCPELTELVLTRADGIDDTLLPEDWMSLPPALARVVLVNTARDHHVTLTRAVADLPDTFLRRVDQHVPSRDCDEYGSSEKEMFYGRNIQRVDVPVYGSSSHFNDINLAQDYVKEKACSRALWEQD